MNQSALGNHEKNRQGAPELSWYCPGGQGDGNKKPGPCGTGKLEDPMKGGCSCSYSQIMRNINPSKIKSDIKWVTFTQRCTSKIDMAR